MDLTMRPVFIWAVGGMCASWPDMRRLTRSNSLQQNGIHAHRSSEHLQAVALCMEARAYVC